MIIKTHNDDDDDERYDPLQCCFVYPYIFADDKDNDNDDAKSYEKLFFSTFIEWFRLFRFQDNNIIIIIKIITAKKIFYNGHHSWLSSGLIKVPTRLLL